MRRAWNAGYRAKDISNVLFTVFFFSSAFVSLCGHCFAEENSTVITSDNLEYFAGAKKYIATGSVKIEKEGTVIQADEMTYFEETTEAFASGNVRYNDKDASIKAGKANLNMDDRTGTLYDAEIYYKKFKYYLFGHEIEKKGEDYYYSPEASFTSCDAPVRAWCFKAKDVDAITGERLKGKDASFRINDQPVFYTPYLWAPINTERTTGFLLPVIGHSTAKGAEVSLPFYWVISENQDATFVLDEYSKRGLGTGVQYRFVEPGGIKADWLIYNIKDTELDRDFLGVKGLYENRNPDNLGGFLSVNYTNQMDFYQQYSNIRNVRVQRFVESTGEINMPLTDSRLYLLSQYWVDLQNPTGLVPERLPEIGYFLDSTKIGNFIVSASASTSNFWAQHAISAGRFDFYPRLAYSVGTDFVLSQVVSLRETAYSLYNNQGGDDIKERAGFEYDVTAHTRLYKEYQSFTHIIEPSISYHFIYSSLNDLPVFDSTELFTTTSDIALSVLNRIIVKGSELMAFRVTQAVDTYNNIKPSQPLKMEVGIKKPVALTMETTYGVDTGRIETITSDLSFPVFRGTVSFGQRYDRILNVSGYTVGAYFSPYKSLQMAGTLWYNAKQGGLTDANLKVRYMRQCWGVRVEADKKPGDSSVRVMFELAGLTSRGSWKNFPGYPETHF